MDEELLGDHRYNDKKRAAEESKESVRDMDVCLTLLGTLTGFLNPITFNLICNYNKGARGMFGSPVDAGDAMGKGFSSSTDLFFVNTSP